MEASEGRLHLDCLLAEEGEKAARPVTLQATMRPSSELETALVMLEEWADDLAGIDVTITGTGPAAELTISSGSGLLHLAPTTA